MAENLTVETTVETRGQSSEDIVDDSGIESHRSDTPQLDEETSQCNSDVNNFYQTEDSSTEFETELEGVATVNTGIEPQAATRKSIDSTANNSRKTNRLLSIFKRLVRIW